jgi:TetR/AcrR family transcriptional regulator, transcriptional repressor for nem operon
MRDPARTRETLLETALELIRHSNYDSIGVNELCSRAGVTKGAFYHHFESKADLYCAAAGHFWEQTKQALDTLCSPASPPLEQLENLIEFIIGRQCAEHGGCGPRGEQDDQAEVVGCPFFTCGVHVGTGEEKFRNAMVEMAENGVRYYVALVRGLKAEGALRDDPDTDQVARMLFQYMHGLFIYGRVRNSIAAIEADLRDGFYRILDLKPEYRRQPAARRSTAYA